MKDVVSLAVFAGKVLCLALFVTVLKPDRINTVQASGRELYCERGISHAQPCDPSLLATLSTNFVGQSGAMPAAHALPRQEAR